MTCQYCKTNNPPGARTCWSCGKELAVANAGAAAAPSNEQKVRTTFMPKTAQKQTGTRHTEAVEPVNTFGDFWMGFFGGWVGVICATIVDKRKGFWASFFGMLSIVAVSLASLFLLGLLGRRTEHIASGAIVSAVAAIAFYFIGTRAK